MNLKASTLPAGLDKIRSALEAIPAIERSLLLDARQPSLWSALVLANQNLGRRQEALNAYQKLREIDAKEAENAYRSVILPLEGAAP